MAQIVVAGGTLGLGAVISVALWAAGHSVGANCGGNDEAAAKFKTETGVEVNGTCPPTRPAPPD